MAYYITRRATIAVAVNTEQQVNTDFDGNTPSIQVPVGVSKIAQVIASVGASIVAVASAGVTLDLRLKGTGLVQGQQDITVGIAREDTTSTGGSKFVPPFVLDTDIPVTPGQTIAMAALMGGVDPGSPEIAVTLVFA